MDDATLLRQFEDLTLPFEEWTHRAHLKICYLSLRADGLEGAIDRLRAGIKAYNAANDVPEGPTSGYNETTTQAFARIVHATMVAYGEAMPTGDADSFCDTHPHLLSKFVLRLFYSPERRLHPEAKTRFVPPDLAPLPAPGGATSGP